MSAKCEICDSTDDVLLAGGNADEHGLCRHCRYDANRERTPAEQAELEAGMAERDRTRNVRQTIWTELGPDGFPTAAQMQTDLAAANKKRRDAEATHPTVETEEAQRDPKETMAYGHRWNGWRTKQPKKNPVVIKQLPS